jgi:hypothetical protein
MAGLGLFFQKSARALAPRGFLLSAYNFLCLILNLHKKAQGTAKGPRAVLIHARSYAQKICFGPPREALVVPPSIQNLVKNTKT